MPRQRNQFITKTHYKAYKAGKRWLFAAISTAAFASAVGFSNPHVTFADTMSEPVSQTGESPTSDSTASGATADPSDSTDSVADGTTDTTAESDEATTPSTPAPNPVSDNNTQALAASAKALDDQVEVAKVNHVSVTETAPTVTRATPETLSEQTASVVATNQNAQATIANASKAQDTNNEAYQTAKTDYDNQTITIASTKDEWTNAEIVHLLADEGGESDVSEATEITDEQRLAASDQVKRAASVTFNKGATVTNVDGTPLASNLLKMSPDNLPAWKYNNAFIDPATGRSINVIESVTDYKVAPNTNENDYFADQGFQVEITNNQIGFTPYNVENISASVQYFYADDGAPATLDVLLGFADMDGHQGVTLDNGFATLIKGSHIGNVDGVYRDTEGGGKAPSDPVTQIWVLQRSVTHTDYTFYVGSNGRGGVDNFQPIQYIGGAAFSTELPTPPTLKSEPVSYSPNQIVVTTQATIQYTGAGDLTPKPEVVPITYTGDFDSTTQKWTWHPDTDAIEITAPILEGYTLDPSADTLALQPLTVDPTDQTYVLHYSQNPLLTVHYLDEAGNHVQPDTTQTDAIGADYKVSAPPRIGNFALNDPQLQTGQYIPGDQSLTFTYSQAKTLLTTHYVDENNHQLQADTTQTGNSGEPFTLDAPSIAGYTLLGKNVSTGVYTGETMEVTFHYVQIGKVGENQATGLTVHYVDQDGNKIDEDAVHSGPLGTNFKVTAKQVPDYTIIGKTEYAGKLVGNVMDITFTYAKRGVVGDNLKTDLTVHYVDQDGNQIDQDTEHSGPIDTNFKVTAKHIPDYTIIGKSEYTGKFVGNTMDITFTYAKRGSVGNNLKTDLTVHYVDQDGNKIDPDAKHSGALGTNFKVTAKHILNYTIIGKTEYTGKLVGNAMDITFTYAKRGTVGNHSKSDLTVHYVDQDGNKITEDDTQSGDLNTGFDVTAKHIPNYTIIGKAEYAGKFVGNAMDITFTYAKRGTVGNNLKTDLTVHYVDQDGNKINEDAEHSGALGTNFKVTAKHIPDYTIVGKTEYTGKFVGNAMDITFTYAKRGTVSNNLKTELTVHYVDQVGNQIDQDAEHSGPIGTNFKVIAKHILDYTIIGKTEYTGKFVGNAMDITFVYAKRGTVGKNLKTDLTVHYIDQDGNQIDQDAEHSGPIGTNFKVTAKHISNYTIIGKTEYTGKFVGNAMDITFTYAKRGVVGDNLNTDLTVHYVDQDGNQIDQDAEHSGPLGTNFKVTAKHIPNYTIIGKTEYTGKFVGNTMDITFTYAKRGTVGNNLKTELTVHSVDQVGNQIDQDAEHSGPLGTNFKVTAKQIPDYTIIGKAEYAGKYVGNTMDLTFTYAKRGVVGNHLKTDLTVHYVDQDGKAIAEDTTQSGDIDSVFEVQAKQIPNYTIIGTREYARKYVGNTMDITFTYAKRGVVGNHHKTDLIVHYVDQDGNPIAPDAVQSGTIGTTFNLDAAEIPGYTIISPSTATGTYQGNTMAYTFMYRQASQLANTKQTQLIKRFVNEKGETIRPDISLYGPTGHTYLAMAQPIAGYTLLGKYAQTGTYQGDVMTLTFVYRQIINDSGTPDTNVTPDVNDPGLEVTPTDETTPTSNPDPTIDPNPSTETVPDIPTQLTNETVPTPDTQPNDVTDPVTEPTPTVDSKPTDESTPITDPDPAIETTPATEIEPHDIDNPEVNTDLVTESKPYHDTLPATNPDDPETPDRNPISDYSDHKKANTDTPIPESLNTSGQPTRSTLPNTDATSDPQLTPVTPTIQSKTQTRIQTTTTRSTKTLPETGDTKQSLFLIAGMSLITLFATGLAATRKRHHTD